MIADGRAEIASFLLETLEIDIEIEGARSGSPAPENTERPEMTASSLRSHRQSSRT
jgi:hypothetical protein